MIDSCPLKVLYSINGSRFIIDNFIIIKQIIIHIPWIVVNHSVLSYYTIDFTECASQPCENKSTCKEEIINSYTCECLGGYSGTNCEIGIDYYYSIYNLNYLDGATISFAY